MRECNTDLQKAALLAMNNYTRMLDPNRHYIPYFFVKLDSDESYAYHSEWDFGDATGRYLDSLISCRLITGCGGYRDYEEKLKDALRWMFCGEDGLSYRMDTNEWVKFGANMFDQRSVLLGLLSWYLENGEDEPYHYIKGMIKGLLKIGVEKEDYICFPFHDHIPGMRIPEEIYTEHGFIVDPAHYGGGVLILPLAVFYEKTGDEEALYLLRKLTNFIIHHSRMFGNDGSFRSLGRYNDDGHFHSKMGTVAGIIRYAICINDKGLLEWADQVYRWARSMGSATGWFPEGVGTNGRKPVKAQGIYFVENTPHSETCCTTDMIHCALYLSKCGFRDYWDHAEEYLNYLLASQITDVSWAGEITDRYDDDTFSYKDIPDRYKGAFTGRALPNDLTNNGKIDTMACCCAAGGRGLHLLWENVITRQEGKTSVNLYISRKADDIDVISDIPDDGALTLNIKKDSHVRVRIPLWLDPGKLETLRNGSRISFIKDGGYANLGLLKAGDNVMLHFPVTGRDTYETIAGTEYKFTWKGSRVVSVGPAGKHMPFYRNMTGGSNEQP